MGVIIIIIMLVVWWFMPTDDQAVRDIAARDKARHDAHRRAEAAYQANRRAQYRAKLRGRNEASRRALVDEHNARVEAARRDPHSSYADRSYWSY